MPENRAGALGPDSPPAVTVADISDPTAAREGIEVLDQDVVHLENKPFRAVRVAVRLTSGVVVFQSTNRRLRTRTKIPDHLMGFHVIGAKAKGSVEGLPMRPDVVLLLPPGGEGEFVVQPEYSSVAFLISLDHLAEHLRVRGRSEELPLPSQLEMRRPSDLGVRPFYDLCKQITDLARRKPVVFNRSEQSRETAQAQVLEMLLGTLGAGSRVDVSRKDRTGQSYSRVIKAAEAYAIAHVATPLYVTDLCRAAHVSERTLQYAFRKILGMTPMTYLTRLKLHRVRQELRLATYGSTTVSAEAIRWGFWHFGDFSRLYGQAFGERPSETLKRAPTAPQ